MLVDKAIWILEDDPGAVFVYEDVLKLRYPIKIFRDLNSFVMALRECVMDKSKGPDLAITDLKVGEESFLDFLTSDESLELLYFPFIVVSSVDDVDVLRLCFDEGATDYLTKPFTKSELLVKVERLLKKQAPLLSVSESSQGKVTFDPSALSLKRGAAAVQLTAKQLQIYAILEKAKGGAVTREEIEREIWGEVAVCSKSLDVHIFHLRQKLKVLNIQLSLVPNVGYCLRLP